MREKTHIKKLIKEYGEPMPIIEKTKEAIYKDFRELVNEYPGLNEQYAFHNFCIQVEKLLK
jgi:hypothetical protein